MGERSQIYVRYNKKLIIANYYQCNWGAAMISRTRHSIEHMKWLLEKGIFSLHSEGIKKLRRYLDVNFDTRDITLSCDIVKEYKEHIAYFNKEWNDEDFSDYCFNQQDCNNGKLFIDISRDYKTNTYSLKYAFLDNDCNTDKIMDAEQYMRWDYANWEDSKYLEDDYREICRNNLAFLKEFEVLTKDELIEFMQIKSVEHE